MLLCDSLIVKTVLSESSTKVQRGSRSSRRYALSEALCSLAYIVIMLKLLHVSCFVYARNSNASIKHDYIWNVMFTIFTKLETFKGLVKKRNIRNKD